MNHTPPPKCRSCVRSLSCELYNNKMINVRCCGNYLDDEHLVDYISSNATSHKRMEDKQK